ncbi:arsinothricin resistance N-acetyltransferase ArsN1 family B [Actibacterium sp. 188UL27-1]|uniref:arsinothricin resistance N-acetyltransferase ArsN1 family B n=1 Tax=Actibacterium sp. 188UL27-1 TaxID=2786961 RepID=UPI00195A5DA1|nr:arsinothricin resistance N-acetyltransferase ArsN1 family B [Actibacterium sp. 188UL27-1]MBM7068590.1 N-acetyltransferase [Actibacterium sp. 188UL27-1]
MPDPAKHMNASSRRDMLVPLHSPGVPAAGPVIVRSIKDADIDQIVEIYAPYVLETAISFEDDVPDSAEMRDRVQNITAASYPYLVAERAGQILGYAYAGPHRSRAAYRYSVDVTVYIKSECHRQGIGRVLYDQLFEELGRGRFQRAFAAIALPNVSSVGLHTALGFELVGVYHKVGYKFDRWHDVSWWQRDVVPGTDE